MRITGILLGMMVLLAACKKDNAETKVVCTTTGGSVTATLNTENYNGCEFSAIFYRRQNVLELVSSDVDVRNRITIDLSVDSLSPLKIYPVGYNTPSHMHIKKKRTVGSVSNTGSVTYEIYYYFGIYKPGNGGSVNLIKLDTLNHRVSADFSGMGYSVDEKENITMQNGSFKDIHLTVSDSLYTDMGFVKVDVNSVPWTMLSVSASIDLSMISNAVRKDFLTVYATPGVPQDNYPSRFIYRNLYFQIPLSINNGTHNFSPQKIPFVYQDFYNPLYIFSAHFYSDEYLSNPTSGTITITHLDTLNRNLDATFTAQTKDSLNNVIQFTNGKMHIINYLRRI